ncbi:MAG: UDP-N-acetyl glucosamine 2-epimerase [Alcanivorax sp.]|nr:UDP-N-acetyl glucosamine 2-epimerase [Alcanivorax sp.]
MIHIVLGTKAQLIKMAPIMAELSRRNIHYRYVSTGQHKDTVAEILLNFNIKSPDVYLYKGKDIVSVGAMFFWLCLILARSFFNKRHIFGERVSKNDIVLVHGDTLSTLAGALMARVAGLKVGHVESGLRSYKLFHPFPEELTRILTFKLSNYLFCPDSIAVRNLKEVRGVKVNTGGNTLYDAVCAVRPSVGGLLLSGDSFAIVTLHRYENFKDRQCVDRVLDIVEMASEHQRLLFVMHKTTIRALKKYGFYERINNNSMIKIIPRMDYFSFIALIKKSEFVISDGGGNQEECFYLGKPILLLREASERQEGLGENCVLSRYNITLAREFVENYRNYERVPYKISARPSKTIVDFLLSLDDAKKNIPT